jgi:transposase
LYVVYFKTWVRVVSHTLRDFDHHASNGPTEAINGRLEALRRTALDSATSTTTACAHYCTAET